MAVDSDLRDSSLVAMAEFMDWFSVFPWSRLPYIGQGCWLNDYIDVTARTLKGTQLPHNDVEGYPKPIDMSPPSPSRTLDWNYVVSPSLHLKITAQLPTTPTWQDRIPHVFLHAISPPGHLSSLQTVRGYMLLGQQRIRRMAWRIDGVA